MSKQKRKKRAIKLANHESGKGNWLKYFFRGERVAPLDEPSPQYRGADEGGVHS